MIGFKLGWIFEGKSFTNTYYIAYLIALEMPLSGSLCWRDLKGLVGVSSAGLLWLPMMDDCPVPVRASFEFTYGGMSISGYWGWY